jgi:general secretion pathway protein A
VEFLQEVLFQFGVTDVPETKVKCLQRLNDRMLENLNMKKETVLMVDEAQLLTEETLEEIRLLLNFQLADRFLVTIILLGQPEVQEKIRAIQQLSQRIAIKYHLVPFDYDDSAQYIDFRQKKAGRKENAFTPEAMERIYENTQGVPRKINNLCDLSLLIGFSKNQKKIESEIVESIVKDGALL